MSDRTTERAAEAEKPTDLPATSWWDALKRTAREFKGDNLPDWSAALTYYAVLSIFPGILVVVSLVGLAGQSVTQDLITSIGELAPGSVKDILTTAVTELQGAAGAGLAAIVGLVAAIWSSSRYVAAFMRASNAIYDIEEGRPIWKTLPLRVAITLVTLTLLSASAIAVVISGGLARELGDLLGFGSTAVTAWNVAKWPILLVVVSFLFSLLYWASPNAKQGFRWVSPGGVVALLIWLAASGGFALYVSWFGSYNKIYGSLAAPIIFLIWLWMSNMALLFGAELNAELERSKFIAKGHPADEEPYVELRDTRALGGDGDHG